MRCIRAAALVAALSICAVAAAWAAPCGSRDSLLASLQRGYGEQVRFRALDARGRLIEVLVSAPDAHGRVTWSLVRTVPGGPSCILTAGEEFETVTPPPAAQDGA